MKGYGSPIRQAVRPEVVAAGAPVLLFTVPSGQTWLVKRTTVQNTAVIAAAPAFSLRVDGINGALQLQTVAGQSVLDREVWWALDEGCELRFDPVGATGLTVCTFGAKLSGVA